MWSLTTTSELATISSKSGKSALASVKRLFQPSKTLLRSSCALRSASCLSLLISACSVDHSANASAYSKASLNWCGCGFTFSCISTGLGVARSSNSFKRFSNDSRCSRSRCASLRASSRCLVSSLNRFSSFGFDFFSSVALISSDSCPLCSSASSVGSVGFSSTTASTGASSARPNLFA